jgi:hypothetical protein
MSDAPLEEFKDSELTVLHEQSGKLLSIPRSQRLRQLADDFLRDVSGVGRFGDLYRSGSVCREGVVVFELVHVVPRDRLGIDGQRHGVIVAVLFADTSVSLELCCRVRRKKWLLGVYGDGRHDVKLDSCVDVREGRWGAKMWVSK